MQILVAPDSFKESFAANALIDIFRKQIAASALQWSINYVAMADGGEGTLDLLEKALKLKKIKITAFDPLYRSRSSYYLSDGNTAFIELAKIIGIELLNPSERNCYHTSSFGLGQLILDALEKGHRKISLFIGGSATQDCGIGIAEALGYKFLSNQNPIKYTRARDLLRISRIDDSQKHALIADCNFDCYTDVDNPLLGPAGAANTYALQKGASINEIEELELGAEMLVRMLNKTQNANQNAMIPGAGSAGGIGFGCRSFLNAKIASASDYLFKVLDLEAQIQSANLIITGEGKLDKQTQRGKLVYKICKVASNKNIPVIVFCAISEIDKFTQDKLGIHKIYSLYNKKPETISIPESTNRLIQAINKFVADWKG